MITTTLAPISIPVQDSVALMEQAYRKAKIDYEILEQQVRNTPLDQFNLLVQLNEELAVAAQKVEAAFDAWSDALDNFVAVPIKPDPLPTPGLRLINGWLYDSHGCRTLA